MARSCFTLTAGQVLAVLPSWLKQQLLAICRENGSALYLTGGSVRDLLRGESPADIDITVPRGAQDLARQLAARTQGALVPLGRGEDAARVVCRKTSVDFSAFRSGATTITEDLRHRDLTINALAVHLDPLLDNEGEGTGGDAVILLDPTGGLADLAQGLIRLAGPASLAEDPLRLLRVFRFAAVYGFRIERQTLAAVQHQQGAIARVASERIAHELDLIMASPRAYAAFSAMADCGLLWQLIPELKAGQGMAQPSSHHLDVLAHSLETLHQMGKLWQGVEQYFPTQGARMVHILADECYRRRLNWAALLHDIGKPFTHAVREDKGGRITFYNHDRAGAALFRQFAKRLHWSNEESERVALLIDNHMRPFHLANEARKGRLTLRASIRMIKRVQRDLAALFLLSMADALAGQGPEAIPSMERELANLYSRLEQVRQEHVEPVQAAPPLVNGHDLIAVLHLEPGPMFKEVLTAVSEAQMEGLVRDREEALRWVAVYVEHGMKQKQPEKE